jgi:hypothetical protein
MTKTILSFQSKTTYSGRKLESIEFLSRRRNKKILFFYLAIQKFAEREWLKKFRRKIFFSGISEAAPANF